MTRVVIAGGGLAAARTCELLRRKGFDGEIVLLAAERRAPYDRPPLTKAALRDEFDPTLRTDYEALSVDLRLGAAARSLHPAERVVGTDSGDVGYDALVIATGASPVRLPGDGPQLVVRTADDAALLRERLRAGARVVLVGESPAAHVRAEDVEVDDRARPSFRLVAPDGQAPVTLPLHGEHHVGNALTAAAVALELGATVADVAARLDAVQRVSARRMEVAETAGGVTVVNDAYNANPESVRAALKSLASMARGGSGRAWAVLGVMGELGEDEVQAHDEIGRLAVRLNIHRLVVVGDQARAMHQGASLEGSWGEESVLVPDVDAAVALLRDELRPGDVVLTKASKVAALWQVAERLLAGDAGRGGDPA